MKWIDKILSWKSGQILTYPDYITKPFFYETYKCDKDLQNKYKEKFIPSNKLIFDQDYTAFAKHIATIKKALKTHDHVYVSTHGLGVPYFHLRIDFEPKYIQTKTFI